MNTIRKLQLDQARATDRSQVVWGLTSPHTSKAVDKLLCRVWAGTCVM